jgi:hypothetical protein
MILVLNFYIINIMKKTTVIAVTGAMVLGVGLLFPTLVSAEDANGETFIQRFAARFNVSEDEVEGVVQEMREEHRTERQVEREGTVDQALEDGGLSERQGEILDAMHQVREEERSSEDFVPGEGQKNRGTMQEGMFDALVESGFDVTEDELDDLRDTTRDLGLGGGGEGLRMGGGEGMGGGKGMGRNI